MTYDSPTSISSVSGASPESAAAGSGQLLSDSTAERTRPSRKLPAFLRGHRILLWVVGFVVVLVSLPLLQSLALKQNEMDALRALRLLGGSLPMGEVHAAEGTPLPQLSALVAEETDLGRRLPDTKLFDDGRLLFHHGYLFEMVETDSGSLGLIAWPLAHGETGLGAFLWNGSGQILGHPNQEALWSGPENAPAWPEEGMQEANPWRPVELTASRE